MKRFILLLIFTAIPFSSTFSQKVIIVDSSFINNEEKETWAYVVEKGKQVSFEEIQKNQDWILLSDFPIVFSHESKTVWLKAKIYNNSNRERRIRIFTKGIDSLNVFWSNGNTGEHTAISGKFIPIISRFVASQFLVVPVNLPAKSYTQIYVRIYNQGYPLSLPYLEIANPNYSNRSIKIGEIGYNIYFGGLLLMILFCIILFLFFQERLYLFYLCCLILSFSMAAIYNDFYYILIDKTPLFIRNKNIFAVLTTLLNIFYLLFAEQYLNVSTKNKSKLILFSRVVIFTLILFLILVIILNKEAFYYRNYFYPLLGANTIVMYYHLLISIQKKYSPSWYFLVATTPIAIVSILEITSSYNGVPIQTMHDLFYTGTFIEIFFLTIGIVYRFRMERSDVERLQQELFVAEINAQDRERERIARDLHDNIGASIVGVQLRLSAFSERFFAEKEPSDDFQKTIQYLEQTSQEVRGLSHELTPQILTNLGLIEQIKEKYGFVSKPIFRLSLPEKNLNLGTFVEFTLYKIINESVQNILKHAKATEVGIELRIDEKILKLRIEDNGIGFDLMQEKYQGMGLSNLKFRVENQLNGSLFIESSPGNGTIISVKVQTKKLPSNK